jgi:hypothetical protein
VLILHDIRSAASPLAKLRINVSRPAGEREADLRHLKRGTRAPASSHLYQVQQRMQELIEQVKTGLCGVQMSRSAGQTRPAVIVGHTTLLRWRECKTEGARPTCCSIGDPRWRRDMGTMRWPLNECCGSRERNGKTRGPSVRKPKILLCTYPECLWEVVDPMSTTAFVRFISHLVIRW